ncbi:hypothetical protein LB519_20130 [Mesorhizobium sp. AD1-1]|nr:hypothetical protein [Mesorhizobium sp. AD1-1]MBZ9720157.1 hypothetical protein [Mesorhizobium sp. AD1-1]
MDQLSRAITQPGSDWRGTVSAIAIDLAGKMAAGLAIGIGITFDRALAG